MVRTSPRKKQQPNTLAAFLAKATPNGTTGKKASAPKRKASPDPSECESHAEEESKPTKKRKTQGKGKSDAMVRFDRTAVSSLKRAMYLGAHVSSAGGVHNAITNAVDIGANSVALFLKSQRKWTAPPLDPSVRDKFRAAAKEHKYAPADHVLPHGSYLVNLAAKDKAKADQAYGAFLDDLQRCEALGIRLYNFHPGNTNGEPRAEAIGRIAAQLNRSHKATKTVVTVLENMAGQGNVVGSSWEDLRDIIAKVEDKERVGVCIDTCHAFAAGYDLRTPEAFKKTMEEFDKVVGKKYLKALHLNDSKAPLKSNRDLHANIGTGFLGLRAFHSVMNHAGFESLPMVLETPIDRPGEGGKTVEDKTVWAEEIKLLESLAGMDADGAEFRDLEAELTRKGAAERGRIQGQADRKAAKSAKKGGKTGGRKKKLDSEDEDSE